MNTLVWLIISFAMNTFSTWRPTPSFVEREVTIDNATYRYQVSIPDNYASRDDWPVILFLHGAGEKGTDGIRQTEVGLGEVIRLDDHRFPAIIVFPQTPEHWHGLGADIALAALDSTLDEFETDTTRIYLTGLSMGGNGAWNLAFLHPERFAAAAIICGWVQGYRDEYYPPVGSFDSSERYTGIAARVQALPIWILHGDADPVVPVEESRRMNAVLQELGADVTYSEFAGVGHNSWDLAYASRELSTWLFTQHLKTE